MSTPKKDWHPADIKAALTKKGYSLVRVAREHGYSGTSAYIVFHKSWHAMEQIIGGIIGVPARKIWPSRYTPGRVVRGPRANRQKRGNRQKSETRTRA